MRGHKYLSILIILCMVLTMVVSPAGVYAYKGNVDLTTTSAEDEHNDADHEGGEKSSKGSSGKGQAGKGGSGKDHSGEADNTHEGETGEEDSEEGGSGKSDGKKGGAGAGGSGSGKGQKGGQDQSQKDLAGGKIELTVTVDWPEGDSGRVVDITLIQGEGEDITETVETTKSNVAVFEVEPSGDCSLEGEEIPGYIAPQQDISLTGDDKIISITLSYKLDSKAVRLDKSKLKLYEGQSEQLEAYLEPGSISNPEVTWDSDNEAVASVTENGLVEGHSAGKTEITATPEAGGNPGICNVTVYSIKDLKDPEPVNDALRDQKVTLPKFVEVTLYDGTNNSTGFLPVVWEYDNKTYDSVFQVPMNIPDLINSFILTGEVEHTDLSVEFVINVDKSATPAINVTGVALNETSKSLNVGEEFDLIAGISPANATNKEVKWSIVDYDKEHEVAAVDENGKVKAITPGLAIVTAETVDGGYKAVCQISVAVAPEISIIFACDENGDTVEEFNDKKEVFINVTNLVKSLGINEPTLYHVKVEEKSSAPELGEGTIEIDDDTVDSNNILKIIKDEDGNLVNVLFNLYDATGFTETDNYSKEYFVSMSQDLNYPKDDEKTLKTNFKIGKAVPTVPEENVDVELDIINGPRRDGYVEGIVFLLCRELDLSASETTWQHYYEGDSSELPYIDPEYPSKKMPIDLEEFLNNFSDEAKMKGVTDENGTVQWRKPKETLKLGGYMLLEVTPEGYIDNLNLGDPTSEDGGLLKEVHLVREGFISRQVINTYIGSDEGKESDEEEGSDDSEGADDSEGSDDFDDTDDSDGLDNVDDSDDSENADDSDGPDSSDNSDHSGGSGSSGSSEDKKDKPATASGQSDLEELVFKKLEGHWAGKHIVELKSNIQIDETLINTLDNDAMGVDVKGLIKLVKKFDFTDYKEFTIQDDTALTREEMIVLAMTVFEFEPITNPILDFLDSDKVSENAKGYIAKASELGIITGYKGNMIRPKQKISKAEIYTIVARCLNIK